MAFEEPKFETPAEEQKPEGDEGFKKEGDLWVPKEERGHIRSAEEVETAREMIAEENKVESAEEREERKEKEWKYGTRTLERIRDAEREWAEEKKAMESAKIPEKGMKTEEILKEVGIEKPAESFEEIEERLKEELKETRVRGGEKLSEAEEIERTRDFYLKELGYSLEYKGLLRGKARVLDAEGKYVVDEKGEPREFKAFFKLEKERTPLIDFLKEELQSKFGKKTEGAAEKTEDEKLEAGFQKATKTAEREQEKRAEKVSSLGDIKKIGKERLTKTVEKFSDVLSYLFVPDKLASLGLREGKKLAVEEGKDLAAANLTPLAAIEEAVRHIIGRVQVGESIRKRFIKKQEIGALEEVPVDERPEDYNERVEEARTSIEQAVRSLIKGQDKLRKKGKLTKLIELLSA